MKKMNRCVHIDFHTMPGISDFDFDAEKTAQILKNANVDYVNLFARCNIGFSYYPTKIGIPYPYMKGDMLGELIAECHKREIGVTAYLNAGLNHELLLRHPEYMKIDKNGVAMGQNRITDNFFRSPCFHSGYREHLLNEIREIIEKEPDGIFCDCLIARPCYCKNCIEKMKAQGTDINDEKAVFDFAYKTIEEICAEIEKTVPDNMRLYLNSAPFDMVAKYVTHAELECLPSGMWGYDFYTTQAPYIRKFHNDRVYMTGRFVNDWGDYAGYKNIASIEYDIYDALLYGYKPSIGDHMHPKSGLDEKFYKQIGNIYQKVMELEKWTDNTEPIVEAAILRNKTTSENLLYNVSGSEKGAARMLAELKICFDTVNEDMDLNAYKLLILPDRTEITDKLKNKLESFKGAIISSGKSINENSIWDYISEFETDTNTDCFYTWDEKTLACYCPGIKMKSDYSISEYIEPYFNKQWDGFHGYFYIPPKTGKGCSAVALKDNKAHICFDIFRAYFESGALFMKELISFLIDKVLKERLIITKDLPSTSRATLMHGKNDLLHIKITYPEKRGNRGIIEEHNILPGGAEISVMGEYKNVYILPEMKKIQSEVTQGRTCITLPQIKGYSVFMLETN